MPARVERLEATLPAGPGGPATARAALTRWLTGQVPVNVLADARLLASELVANSAGGEPTGEERSLWLAVQLRDGALRVEVRDPSRAGSGAHSEPAAGYSLQLVESLASRWGADGDGTQLWFEVDAA